MVKQSLGLPSSNYRLRPDTRLHLALPTALNHLHTGNGHYKVRRQAWWSELHRCSQSLHGYNMQDAVIMNRSGVQRALGRSTFNRTYNAERRRFPGGQVEEIEIPGTGLEESRA